MTKLRISFELRFVTFRTLDTNSVSPGLVDPLQNLLETLGNPLKVRSHFVDSKSDPALAGEGKAFKLLMLDQRPEVAWGFHKTFNLDVYSC